MIIAIDESGDFNPQSAKLNFFVSVHLRQNEKLYLSKKEQFRNWESTIPHSFKNHKGEIKSSKLEAKYLESFANEVLIADPIIGITPISFIPIQNSKTVIEKHKALQIAGINNGIIMYAKQGKEKLVKAHKSFANWLRNLNYQHYIKIILLGKCMVDSLRDAIGHSISGGFDNELPKLNYLVDEIFLRGFEQTWFWQHLLRNQLYSLTKQDPIPVLDTWENTGHPFLEKYAPTGVFDLNELFWKNHKFVKSHHFFEIRIADATNTILSKYWNSKELQTTYESVVKCFNGDKNIPVVVLKDFDFDHRIGLISENPWGNAE